jgi:hypothetical protein
VLRKATIFIAVLSVVAGLKLLSAQMSGIQMPGAPPSRSVQEHEMEERRAKEANKKRQEEIRNDTLKLYQLATELKDAVDKTNENMLSLDVVKKADEVEKLAKKVKEKMREGTATPPPLPKHDDRWPSSH